MVRWTPWSSWPFIHLYCRKFSAAHIDPEIADQDPTAEEEDVEVRMPSPEMQYHLLQLYFTYVHPFFPVVHKQDFLYHYNSLYVLPYFSGLWSLPIGTSCCSQSV